MRVMNLRSVLLGCSHFCFSLYFCLSLSACGLGQTSERYFFRSESPDGLYTVLLSGDGDRPLVGTNVVNAEVLRNGDNYVEPTIFHTADPSDLSFNIGYARHKWVGNNVLQFYRTPSHPLSAKPIPVTIINGSTRNIAFIKLFCADKLLILDIPTRAIQNLECSAPMGDFVDFFVAGRFVDGQTFKHGSSFRNQAGRISYNIQIDQTGVTFVANESDRRDKNHE